MNLRVIVGAMMGGVLTFSIVALSGMFSPDEPDRGFATILGGVWVVMAMGMTVGFFVFRGSVLSKLRADASAAADGDDERIISAVAQQWTNLSIIAAGMAEGLGLFAAVIVLITGEKVAAVGSLVSLIALALLFPSKSGWASLASSLAGRQIRID